MRYDTTISYQNKRVSIKVTNKTYSGSFELPDFLKAVRIAKGQDYTELCKISSSWNAHDCIAYESGELPIPRKYLSFFCIWYGLPIKLVNLGVVDEQHKESPLALRLKELRLNAGYSQEDFAKKIEMSRSTYSHYELGNSIPDLPTLIRIANVHRVSLDYLADRKYE